ncbi:MAG: hypothetical protein ABIE43_01370 [Patescibacteria group bacterium]
MKIFKYLIIILFFAIVSAQVCLASEVNIGNELEKAGETSGPYAPATGYRMSEIIGLAVNACLSILGIYFIILTIYGGYTYMNARGEEERVTRGLATIRHAVIGLLIVVGSYAIWNFVFTNLIG